MHQPESSFYLFQNNIHLYMKFLAQTTQHPLYHDKFRHKITPSLE